MAPKEKAEKEVSVDLENSVGIRRGPHAGKLYGPGKGVAMPASVAETLGLQTTKRAAAEGDAADDDEDVDDVDPVDEMTRSELEAEAERLNIDISDGGGENANGEYSVAQLREKIKEANGE